MASLGNEPLVEITSQDAMSCEKLKQLTQMMARTAPRQAISYIFHFLEICFIR
jgi:hypothetical protein